MIASDIAPNQIKTPTCNGANCNVATNVLQVCSLSCQVFAMTSSQAGCMLMQACASTALPNAQLQTHVVFMCATGALFKDKSNCDRS